MSVFGAGILFLTFGVSRWSVLHVGYGWWYSVYGSSI